MELSPMEYCARHKLRFRSNQGVNALSVEELWDLPLVSTTGKTNLNDIAKGIHATLRQDETNFVETETDTHDVDGTMKLEAVKRVIAVKQAERKAAATAREKSEQKQKIMALIAERRDDALKGKPLEELEAMLAGL
jgi:hypothetical protein